MLTALALGSALIARSAAAQHGSSASLTHTVSVTVPPRVRVQVGNLVPASQSVSRVSSVQSSSDGLAVSISATQPWSLSIASGAKSSQLQWSRDRISGFANVSADDATVTSGTLSEVPTTAGLFFRTIPTTESSNPVSTGGSAAVVLTVVAQ